MTWSWSAPGPAGLSAAIRLKQLAARPAATFGLRPRERQRGRRAHLVGRGDRPDCAQRADSRLEGQGRAADRAGERKPPLAADEEGQVGDAACPASAVHAQQGDVHAEPGQFVPLARRPGGGARGRDFPRLSRGGDPLQRGRVGEGRRDRRHGHRPRRFAPPRLPAGDRAPCPLHLLRRGRARSSDQAADRDLRPARGKRTAGFRAWRQGVVGRSCGET